MKREDLGVLLACALLQAAFLTFLGTQMPAELYGDAGWNRWFDADVPRVVQTMTTRWDGHGRNNVHPWWGWYSLPLGLLLHHGLHLSAIDTARTLAGLYAAVWAGLLHATLGAWGHSRAGRVLWSSVATLTGGVLCFGTVPETYLLSSATLLLPLLLLGLAARGTLSDRWAFGGVVLSASVTITDGMSGALLAVHQWGWRRGLALGAAAVAVLVLVALPQRVLAPGAARPWELAQDRQFARTVNAEGTRQALTALWSHSILLPTVGRRVDHMRPENEVLSVQRSAPGSGGPLGPVLLGGWAALLMSGILALARGPELRALRAPLALLLAGQVGLHLVYGVETFLYAAHLAPLLVLLAAGGTVGRPRAALWPVGIFGMLLAVHNLTQWRGYVTELTTLLRP